MKNAATAIHTTRQKITNIQRSRYFRLDLPACPEALRSWLSSFMSGSAWCFMTIAGKLLFHHREFQSDPGVQRKHLRAIKSHGSGLSSRQAALHCTESCPEWERYAFYLVQGWKPASATMLASAAIPRARNAHFCLRRTRAVPRFKELPDHSIVLLLRDCRRKVAAYVSRNCLSMMVR